MFGLGHWELIIILIIILIIFGAGKLPEIGGGMGKAIRNFKKGVTDSDKEDTKITDHYSKEEKTETDKIEEK